MLEITAVSDGELQLAGRFDAAQVEKARGVLLSLSRDTTLDFGQLDYISSAGLGVLLATQKKLQGQGQKLRLSNVNRHIRDVLHFSGFDQIFEIV